MRIFWKNMDKTKTVHKDICEDSLRFGFTLLELLIVMVIVSVLVALALPKYQNALERGRALEGMRNAQYVAEYMSAKHMTTKDWPQQAELGRLMGTDVIKSRFFNMPSFDGTTQTVTISRTQGDWSYSFEAKIEDDEVTSIVCISESDANDCEALDLGSGRGESEGDNLMERK